MKFSKLGVEKIIGGVFGLIAIIAAILEMKDNGFSSVIIYGGIKYISGIMVAVMVFLIAINSYLNNRPKNLEEELKNKFNEFEQKNIPQIYRVKNYIQAQNSKYIQGFCILQDFSLFPELCGNVEKDSNKYNELSDYKSKSTGKFLDLSDYNTILSKNFNIKFSFIKSSSYSSEYKDKILEAISKKFNNKYKVHHKSNDFFELDIPKIEDKKDITEMVSLFEFVITLYQIGNMGFNK